MGRQKKGSWSVIFSFMFTQDIKMIFLNLQTEPVLDLVKVCFWMIFITEGNHNQLVNK
jgi:hypothetical protein